MDNTSLGVMADRWMSRAVQVVRGTESVHSGGATSPARSRRLSGAGLNTA
jgi:hypothetical protein